MLINDETARRKTEEISLQALGNLPLSIWIDIISVCEQISIVCLSQVCFAFYHPSKRHIQAREVTIAGNGMPGVKDGPGKDAQFNQPCGLCFRETDECLYIADYGNHKIRRVDTNTGMVSTVAGTGEPGYMDGSGDMARFHMPGDVKLTWDGGSLLVADTINHLIRCVTLPEQGHPVRVETLAGSGVSGHVDGSALEGKLSSPYAICADENDAIYVADTNNHRIRKLSYL